MIGKGEEDIKPALEEMVKFFTLCRKRESDQCAAAAVAVSAASAVTTFPSRSVCGSLHHTLLGQMERTSTSSAQSMSCCPPAVNVVGEGEDSEHFIVPAVARKETSSCLVSPPFFLPLQPVDTRRPITLLLDLDETLVHSSTSNSNGSFDTLLDINVDNRRLTVFVKYRPFLHEFLHFVSELFEVVIFTASHSAYCNPLMDRIDPERKLGPLRLFREHCTRRGNSYVKDLHLLGRPLHRVALLDNSPSAYFFQPRNGIPIQSWFGDMGDHALLDIIPTLGRLSRVESVYSLLDGYNLVGRC